MKKTLIVLLTAVLSISMLFVSCSNEAKFDETVQIGFSSDSVRGLTASQDIPGSDDLYWFYKASKTPGSEGSQITIGTKTEWTPVKLNAKGLTPDENGGLITLAQGRWDFELQGRIDKNDVNTSVYQGLTSNVLIVKHGEEVNTITVSVSQLATGTGTVKLSNIKVKSDEANFTDYKPTSYKYRASGSTEWNVVTNADFTSDIEKDLPAATYDFVVMYDKVDGGETIVYASAPITITVTANITTTITGSLDVETTMGQFDVNVVGTKATASFTAGASENAITVPITPSAEQGAKTTVTFEEGAVSGKTILVTEVKTIEEALSANFNVSNGSAIAAIDLKITDGDGASKSIANGKAVTVETYILKDLSKENIQVIYNGNGDQPTDVNYDPESGKLTFKTNHFSEFYVVSDAVCYNTDKYVGYPDLNAAVDGASDGDTIVLFDDITMAYTEGSPCITIDNKDITIDGSGKTVTLSANNANKDQYGIFITGSDNSKTVTIKNATINTEKLERAIRTEGSIGVKIEKCTITTNGVGVHVKGSNKVDIINTQITVNVIDNSTFSAHKRVGVMVGGPNAYVTVGECTISALNQDKINEDTTTWCKGLYAGNSALNGVLTVNNTKVEADFSIGIDGTGNIEQPSMITINSGEYYGIIGTPSGGSYKSLIINGGTFTGIDNFGSFYGKNNSIAKLVISGGKFNVEPDSKFIVTGKTTIKEGDCYRVVYSTTEDELKQMIASGNPTIDIYGEIELTSNLSVNRDVTIIGHNAKIKGFSTYIGANNNVKFVNVEFADTTKNDKASSVYGDGFAGTVTFENCTFGNSNWESLQFTPKGDATIVIKDCSFKATKDMKRFIHIQPAASNSYILNVTITDSTFKGCENVNYSSSDTVSVIDLDYIANDSTLTLGGCQFYNTDGSVATNAHAYFCKPASGYERSYDYDQMYTMLTGTSTSYTIQ